MTSSSAKIRLLDDHLINQIAAGEVVERPVSIVKELIENSLDAGATNISVTVENAGIDRIVVHDNGSGIAAEDLPRALQRHCTSKISRSDELLDLRSLGFRGEALASIGSVTDLTITSKTSATEYGFSVSNTAADKTTTSPATHPLGTTVEARNLFVRIPARRRFLKQARTEYSHISQLLRQFSFCFPATGFQLISDGKTVLPAEPITSSGTQFDLQARRWRTVFGKEFISEAVPVGLGTDGVTVSGLLGGVGYSRPKADIQYLCVNNRIIRDRRLSHAVRVGFGESIPEGRYPAYALRIDLPASDVDVNVHPMKTEVRFRQLRQVHDIVVKAVRDSLESTAEIDAAIASPLVVGTGESAVNSARPDHISDNTSPSYGRSHHSAARNFRGNAKNRSLFGQANHAAIPGYIGVVHDRFVIVENDESVHVLDLKEVVYALMRAKLKDDCVPKPLLIPERLPNELNRRAQDLIGCLGSHGIEISEISQETYVLRTLPTQLVEVLPSRFLAYFVDLADISGRATEVVAHAAACSYVLPNTLSTKKDWVRNIIGQCRALDIFEPLRGRRLDVADWQSFIAK